MHISKNSATQIVEEISKLVKQNINLMDETGHIIASCDKERIGQSFKVVGRCSTKDSDLSSLPMWNIKFSDGTVIGAYPEEIIPREMKENGCPLEGIE